jgi:hypothetical protein
LTHLTIPDVAGNLAALPISSLRLHRLELGSLPSTTANMVVLLLKHSSSSLTHLMLPHIDGNIVVEQENGTTATSSSSSSTNNHHSISSSEWLTTPTVMPNLISLSTSRFPVASASWSFPVIIAPNLELLATWLPCHRVAHLLAFNQSRLKHLNWFPSNFPPSIESSPSLPNPIVRMCDVPLTACQRLESILLERSLHDFMALLDRCRSSIVLTKISWDSTETPLKRRTTPETATTVVNKVPNCDLASLLSHVPNLTKLDLTACIEWSSDSHSDVDLNSSSSFTSSSSDGDVKGKKEYCLERLEFLVLAGNWLSSSFLSKLHLPRVKSICIRDPFLCEQTFSPTPSLPPSSTTSCTDHPFLSMMAMGTTELIDLSLRDWNTTGSPLSNNGQNDIVGAAPTPPPPPPPPPTVVGPPSTLICVTQLRRIVCTWNVRIDIILDLLRHYVASTSPTIKTLEERKCQLIHFHYYPFGWFTHPSDSPSSIENVKSTNHWLTIIPLLPSSIELIGPFSSIDQVRLALHHLPHLRTIQLLRMNKAEAIGIYNEVKTYCQHHPHHHHTGDVDSLTSKRSNNDDICCIRVLSRLCNNNNNIKHGITIEFADSNGGIDTALFGDPSTWSASSSWFLQ